MHPLFDTNIGGEKFYMEVDEKRTHDYDDDDDDDDDD